MISRRKLSRKKQIPISSQLQSQQDQTPQTLLSVPVHQQIQISAQPQQDQTHQTLLPVPIRQQIPDLQSTMKIVVPIPGKIANY